jgi:hypothetical protein
MVVAHVKTRFDGKRVVNAAGRASITTLGHAGAAIRLAARHSIRKSRGPSAPGTPPHTRKGRFRSAIRYAITSDRESVVVGPDHTLVADAGGAHEFGGRYRDEHYPRRPFMGPALERVKDRLPPMWAGSVK